MSPAEFIGKQVIVRMRSGQRYEGRLREDNPITRRMILVEVINPPGNGYSQVALVHEEIEGIWFK